MAEEFTESELIEKRELFVNTLLYETPGGLRFTQDSPILPTVWSAYAEDPRSQQELILTTGWNEGAGQAARQLRTMLNALRDKRPTLGEGGEPRRRARVSYIPGQLAVRLYFDELMRVVLPLTPWWNETTKHLKKIKKRFAAQDQSVDGKSFFPDAIREETLVEDLTDALMIMRHEIDSFTHSNNSPDDAPDVPTTARQKYVHEISPDICWLVRIAGILADAFESGKPLLSGDDSLSSLLNTDFKTRYFERIETSRERNKRLDEVRLSTERAREVRSDIVKSFVGMYRRWDEDDEHCGEKLIWRITKNREVRLAVSKSALTIKADAARRLFDISCENITWAVLDSGIDAGHPAFRQTYVDPDDPEFEDKGNSIELADLPNRVRLTLDFTRLRELLDFDIDAQKDSANSKKRRQRVEKLIRSNMGIDGSEKDANGLDEAERLLEGLRNRIRNGKEISWQDLEAALIVKKPAPPNNDHGTHVAGILGADWIEDHPDERNLPLAVRSRRMVGVCPDINLIDVRVFKEDGFDR